MKLGKFDKNELYNAAIFVLIRLYHSHFELLTVQLPLRLQVSKISLMSKHDMAAHCFI